MLFDQVCYIVGYSPDLRLVIRFTDDKKISNGFGDLPQVKRNNVSAFLFLDRPYDGFKDFRIPVQSGSAFLSTGQNF